MIINLTITGLTEARVRFDKIAANAADVRPASIFIIDVLRNAAKETFDMMGERGDGEAWDPGSPEWLARKIREGYDPRPEMMTHKLYKSLTTAGVTRVTRQSVSLGSGVRYTKYQKNQLIKLTAEDRNEIRQIWFDYIVSKR